MLRILKLFFVIAIFYLVVVILEYARQGFIEDLSMQPHNKANIPYPTYLISYASGPEYFHRNQNALAHYALNKNIDFILNYNEKHIDNDFKEINNSILNKSPGGGMWLWKPYIIDKTLSESSNGSIIIYLDAAFKIKKPLYQLFNKLNESDIILAHDHNRLNGEFIKGDSFKLLNCLSQSCRYSPHIMSGAIIIKNTEYSRKFIKKWLIAMQDEQILSNKNFGINDNYPEFKWHHFDQSVLSLIYFNNQEKVSLIEFDELSEYVSLFHRKPSKSSPNKDYYTIYGIDPLINNNKYGKNLPSTSLLNFPPMVYLRKLALEVFN